MSRGLILSEKHGVNPTMPVCFFCNKEKGEIYLLGRMKGDREAPLRAVWNMEPCPECAHYMEKGIILISVDPELTSDKNNPWRTGGWVVVKEEAVRKIFEKGPLLDSIMEHRFAFVEDDCWDAIDLPRPEEKEAKNG